LVDPTALESALQIRDNTVPPTKAQPWCVWWVTIAMVGHRLLLLARLLLGGTALQPLRRQPVCNVRRAPSVWVALRIKVPALVLLGTTVLLALLLLMALSAPWAPSAWAALRPRWNAPAKQAIGAPKARPLLVVSNHLLEPTAKAALLCRHPAQPMPEASVRKVRVLRKVVLAYRESGVVVALP